ncbi:sulfite exporter TauE/SafE family protein [Streptomyces sp. NBC_01275]|uniref:sulfite exporter TauE/SafE family protein n=1 Tax=Streptomyces sp. NBC_01275 TaxID=2903807 RepID=UPI002257C212|nr:sulfite exporter TauE/SafE family protein [Streptomyces sp. NBC_01275]MCX4763783.1 sulfite exporter TauE/SafE family protein [Streptomyces sp. NBC_01275]
MTSGAGTADAALAGIVLLGSCVQWLTGMGFALVAVPALVLLLGPAEGVVLANCAAGAISVVGLASGWRRVRLSTMVPLCAAAACTVPAGAWLTRRLPEPALLLTMGALVTAAVLLVLRGVRVPALHGTRGALAAGATGGFMNAAAGVGGPPISLYAVNAGWTVREFVPNAQFYGVLVNAFSVAANGVPKLAAPQWTSVAVAMTVGALVGRGLAGRLPEPRARLLVLGLALAGGVVTVGKGIWGL